MDQENQRKSLESLLDWSKWLITINFGAATGCTLALHPQATAIRPIIILAILFFCLAGLSSAVLIYILAKVNERLPLIGNDSKPQSLFNQRICDSITIGSLSKCQLALTVTGAMFFLTWVALRPVPKDALGRNDVRAAITGVASHFRDPDYSYNSTMRNPSIVVEGDINLINFGNAPATIVNVTLFAAAFESNYPIQASLDDIAKGGVGGYPVSWHKAPFVLFTNSTVKQHVLFDPIPFITLDRTPSSSTRVLVGAEFAILDSAGHDHYTRIPVLCLDTNVTRAERFANVLGADNETLRPTSR